MVMDGRHRKPLQRALMAAAVSDITRITVNEWAEIRSVTPNTTSNYNSSGNMEARRALTNGAITDQRKIVMKFSSRIPTTLIAPIYLGLGFATDHPGVALLKGGAAGATTGTYSVETLQTDFDCSAVTWNNIQASVGEQIIGKIIASDWNGGAGWNVASGHRGIVTPFQAPSPVTSFWSAIEGAYGIVVVVDSFTTPVNSWSANIVVTISEEKAYLEYGS